MNEIAGQPLGVWVIAGTLILMTLFWWALCIRVGVALGMWIIKPFRKSSEQLEVIKQKKAIRKLQKNKPLDKYQRAMRRVENA